jgi:hypothetical protein
MPVLKRLLATGAVTAALLAPAVVPAAASAAPTLAAAGCRIHRVGAHWECVTPGAFCARAAHGKWGYAKVTHRKYWCKYRSGDIRWRWLR